MVRLLGVRGVTQVTTERKNSVDGMLSAGPWIGRVVCGSGVQRQGLHLNVGCGDYQQLDSGTKPQEEMNVE